MSTPDGLHLDGTDTDYIADRSDVFRAAYALVSPHEWENGLDVADVLRVAEFLAGDGIRDAG